MTVHNILAGTAADEDITVPAPTGTSWGPRRVEPPPVLPMPAAAAPSPCRDPWPLQRAIQREYRRGFWWGLLCGIAWAVVGAAALGFALGVMEHRPAERQAVTRT